MVTRQLSVTDFKARCTALLRDLEAHPQRIEVTNRGRVIAVVAPPVVEGAADPSAWLGSLRGSVLLPVESSASGIDTTEWDVMRD